MKDDMDIMRQCSQLYAQGNALARRFHNVLGQCESNCVLSGNLYLFFYKRVKASQNYIVQAMCI